MSRILHQVAIFKTPLRHNLIAGFNKFGLQSVFPVREVTYTSSLENQSLNHSARFKGPPTSEIYEKFFIKALYEWLSLMNQRKFSKRWLLCLFSYYSTKVSFELFTSRKSQSYQTWIFLQNSFKPNSNSQMRMYPSTIFKFSKRFTVYHD